MLSYLSWREPSEVGLSPQQQQGPTVASDYFVRAVASQLVQHLRADANTLCGAKPDIDVAKSVIRLAWASSSGDFKLLSSTWEELGTMPLVVGTTQYQDEYCEDVQLCRYVFVLVFWPGIARFFVCPSQCSQRPLES